MQKFDCIPTLNYVNYLCPFWNKHVKYFILPIILWFHPIEHFSTYYVICKINMAYNYFTESIDDRNYIFFYFNKLNEHKIFEIYIF